jgi:hypothetical protein
MALALVSPSDPDALDAAAAEALAALPEAPPAAGAGAPPPPPPVERPTPADVAACVRVALVGAAVLLAARVSVKLGVAIADAAPKASANLAASLAPRLTRPQAWALGAALGLLAEPALSALLEDARGVVARAAAAGPAPLAVAQVTA